MVPLGADHRQAVAADCGVGWGLHGGPGTGGDGDAPAKSRRAEVRGVLSAQELSDLTFSVAAINAWNRVNIGLRPVPGSADTAFGLDKAGLA